MKTLKEISDIVLALPPVVSGFIQQTEGLEEHVVSKVPGGAGSTIKGQRYSTQYRCFIRTDSAFAERSDPSLVAAIYETLKELKIKMPQL